jgi:hypothetical protein
MSWLTETFHQPFGDLRVACESMDERIRQVRLCVEVLRHHLAGLVIPQTAADRLAADEAGYRIAAYRAVLERIGTSYDEVRLIRDAKPAERAQLAGRLGFSLGPTRPDRLGDLLLDPKTLTEADLERLFGLVDTRTSRDALSDGLVLDDPEGQIHRWDLTRTEWRRAVLEEREATWRGVEWRRTTDDEGLIHVTLKGLVGGTVRLELYRDAARTELLGDGERPNAVGSIELVERNGSGLSGVIDVRYVADGATIMLSAVPRLLSWRLAELRATWAEQDRSPVGPRWPNVDPDLIEPADLRDPLSGPAFALWQARRAEIDQLLKDLRDARQAAATPAAALDAALLHPQSLGLSGTELGDLAKKRDGGTDIRPTLEASQLSLPGFEFLLHIHRLVSASPPSTVLDEEWDGVDAVLARVYKTRQAQAWRDQEGPPAVAAPGITLGPDFFILPKAAEGDFPPPTPRELRRWLAPREARRDWERTLRARSEQHRDTIAAFRDAIDAAEEATIIALRDALVRACGSFLPGTVPAAKKLGDLLLIDCQNTACQITTRVAQALETIQVLLFSVRTGQLLDTYPTVDLLAPDFDREWHWIGSYASWRAAVLVFMYPSHPALRHRQSPGFKRLVRNLRALAAITPEKARPLAKEYQAYFEDVCRLQVEASCSTLTRQSVEDREVLHLFGRRHPDGATVYWSTFDRPPEPQSFWDWVPGLQDEHVLEVIGATAYRLPSGERFLYVFVRAIRHGTQTLLFTRYSLQRGVWDVGHTALDPPHRGQDFEAVLISGPEDQPPLLHLRHPPGGGEGSAIFRRPLNRDGTGWAEGEWFRLIFSPWFGIGSLHAQPGTKVATAATATERIELVTVGEDGGVYHAWWGLPPNGPGWTDWQRVDGTFKVPSGSPVTIFHTQANPDQFELFVVGEDRRLWTIKAQLTPSGPQWSTWSTIGGPTNTLPHRTPITAVVRTAHALTLLLMLREGTDNFGVVTCARRSSFSNAFEPWLDIGNPAVNRFPRPAPVAAGTPWSELPAGSTLIYLVGTDGKIWASVGQLEHTADRWGNTVANAFYEIPTLVVPLGSPIAMRIPIWSASWRRDSPNRMER